MNCTAQQRVHGDIDIVTAHVESALLGQLESSGAVRPRLEPACDDAATAAQVGCSIRMSYADATVQEFTLVGSEDTVGEFVRWIFSLPADSELSGADLLDALGETLNQVAGRLKELILADGEGEPLLGVPSFARRQNVVLATQRTDNARYSLVSESWRGVVGVSITARQPLPLHLLAECGQTLHHLEGNDCFIRIQSLVADLKESQRCAPPSIMSVLSACDEMAVSAVQSGGDPDYATRQLLARFLSLGPLIVGRLEALHGDFVLPPAAEDIELLWEYVEDANAQVEGARKALSNPGQEALVVVFRALHTLKGNSGFFGLHQIQQLAHTTEDFVAQLQSGTYECGHVASQLVRTSLELVTTVHGRLEEILETGGTLPYQSLIAAHVAHLAAIVKGDRPLELSGAAVVATDNRAANEEWFKLRVSDLERIERMLEKLATLIGRPDVGAIEAQLVEVHDTLTTAVVSVRRVPLDMLLSKVGRLCRETANELDKLVRVETHATGVNVPKHIFAALSGSLVHLARNAIDHGLENQEQRRTSGKPPMATVTCTACWEDGSLIVEVRDDGRGISAGRVADKAIGQGLISHDHSLSDAEIVQLVLAPGFSTAEQVSAISGRGVGLDVVRSDIESVGGHVEIETTVGEGTCFRLTLPETPDLASDADPEQPNDADLDCVPELAGDGELNLL